MLTDSIPSVAQALALGFQHYFVMLGTSIIIPTILVPQMGGDLVSCSFEFRHVQVMAFHGVITFHIVE